MKQISVLRLSVPILLITAIGAGWSSTAKASCNGQEQIDWICAQQDLHATGLVDSYENYSDDEAWIYDQALAIIALTNAGELVRARMVLDELQDLQLANGAWYEGYHAADATKINSKHVTGPIAWVVMGINYYERRTGDSNYAAVAARALGWMDTMRNTNPANERYGSLNFSNLDLVTISTEHNVDAYSAYYWRGILDSNSSYLAKADLVLDYLRTEMWAPSTDSNDIHDVNIFWEGWANFSYSTDPQSWVVLSLGPIGPDGEDFAASLDWLWSALYGNTRTVQDYNASVLDVEGFKSGTGEATDYVWVEATDGVASAYYSVGDNARGDFFHSEMARTAASGGLVHSFCEVDPEIIRWPENLRHEHLASVAWYYYNEVTPKINPFQPPPPDAVDHYKVYGLTPEVTPIPDVHLADQFGSGPVDLTNLGKLGVPVSKAIAPDPPAHLPGGLLRPFEHLTWYEFSESQPERFARLKNQFTSENKGAIWLIGDGHFLLVPASKDGQGAIELGQHWKCYDADLRVKLSQGRTLPDVTANLLDQFQLEEDVVVEPGRYVCNPVEKNFEGAPPLPDEHLACYAISGATPVGDPHPLLDQFGPHDGFVESPELLCLPSQKFLGAGADFDNDGVEDAIDNCSEDVNGGQDDTDADDCGNLCDCDYKQSGFCEFGDFLQFAGAFGIPPFPPFPPTDEEKCHVEPIPGCTVGFADFLFFAGGFGSPPGPSGTTAGTTACP
jgi:hypothetical protein